MSKEQYDFSNQFWSDPEWNKSEGIPKHWELDEDGNISKFILLTPSEIKDFMKIKMLEDPNLLRCLRFKKLKRIVQHKLRIGERNGFVKDFDRVKNLKRIHKKYLNNDENNS